VDAATNKVNARPQSKRISSAIPKNGTVMSLF